MRATATARTAGRIARRTAGATLTCATLVAIALAGGAAGDDATVANPVPRFSTSTSDRLPEGWHPQPFRDVPPTTYSIARDGDVPVVRADASASASGLAFRFERPLDADRTLRWRWKGERLPPGGDTRARATDDAVARVYVTFAAPAGGRGTVDRMRDATLRMLYGETPPHATLLYVWDTAAPAGATFANAYTERVRNVVVESGPARLGEWIAYARDVADDYRRAFGEAPGRIRGIAIMTDADNTKSRASALFGDLTLDAR